MYGLFENASYLSKLAAFRAARLRGPMLAKERGIGIRARTHRVPCKKARVSRLIENFPQSAEEQSYRASEPCRGRPRPSRPTLGRRSCVRTRLYCRATHTRSSAAKRVGTNGASRTLACIRPETTLTHTEIDSSKMSATMQTRTPATAASSRSFKIKREISGLGVADDTSCRACARNPILGFGSKILCQDAVKVTATSHRSGTRVTGE